MKKIRFSIVVLGLLAGSFQALAQTPEQETRYQNGRALLDQKKYSLAMAELLPLTNVASGNPRAAEASYLYAVAAVNANKMLEAYNMLQQLTRNAPDWGNIEEAYYLQAKLAFDQQDYETGIRNLQVVESDFIKADAQNLERSYLLSLGDKNRFKSLLQQFPDDKVLAKTYADKLAAGWYAPEDRGTLENIIRKFNLEASAYNPDKMKAGGKKTEYNVAVLLPFSVNADAATRRKNQFAADLFAGMKLAQDSLSKNNLLLNLFSYEVGTDTASAGKVFRLPELKTMDLVIGPVYKATARQTSGFARNNRVNVVNPLSEDLEVINGNPNLFMFESSVVTRAQRAADFAYENFEQKPAAIIFENIKDDTIFANAYRKQFELRGGKVKLYKKINTKKNPNVMAIYKNVDLKTFGHLVVVSDNLPAAVATVSQVQSQNPKLPVITKETWLEMPQLSLQQLDETELYFIYPKYADLKNASVRQFRRKFTSAYNIPPSPYAFAGFEMLFRFGSLLNAYGPDFETFLPQTNTVSGTLYPAYNYVTGRDNQFVPILKLENKQLVLMNPVNK
ncbi:ABC transporter substrate-binding protein [Adhaeribacter sp. BT258]|uniref:ABC transporter substrate-binding protein n=1 Tax=Adhaeribacter terrigena TaxID=2793070 RepID=A0ABS1C3P5_9BACT|nr:ABC transporter substrate-binding protein [Adhaeribacter terrigena]MBK0403792.1 ABC transporter substrate-binding protein [Adhaeribacter terrigena]